MEAQYFQVVWCNWSTKKVRRTILRPKIDLAQHIKWEGDGLSDCRGLATDQLVCSVLDGARAGGGDEGPRGQGVRQTY